MKITDFDNLQILTDGYREEEKTDDDGTKKQIHRCIYCEKEIPLTDMPAHLAQHSDSEKLAIYLHADSIITFTAKEKKYLSLAFLGDDDKTIAAKMGIPEVSARRMGGEFRNQIRHSRRVLAMTKLLGNNLDRQKRSESIPIHTEMPVLDEAGMVKGFCKTKRELHESKALHGTTLIVVVKKLETGPAILVVDKGNQKISFNEDDLFLTVYDVLGGHVRVCDWATELDRKFGYNELDKQYDYHELIDKPFPKEKAMWACAQREQKDELISPKQSNESLSFWFEDRYTGQNDEGVNDEITWVFLCRYQNANPAASKQLNISGEVRIKDEWIDSIGRTTPHTYVGRFWRIPDLREELKKPTVKALDGLERVLKKLDDPAAMKHLMDWLG
ncbi:hypothetical protein LJC63_02080 [Ruminococcaceae bacterium OttesenSCG-928-L11]|nr:hypothetical protein [Ruminococcaceae bacterium OttesenSCG-928-L11]